MCVLEYCILDYHIVDEAPGESPNAMNWAHAFGRNILPKAVRRAGRSWMERKARRRMLREQAYRILEDGAPNATHREWHPALGQVPPHARPEDAGYRTGRGWSDPSLPQRQLEAFQPLLEKMREGFPREDFTALAAAVHATGTQHPFIVEVGCGSGWNSEVLTHMLGRSVRYAGIDYSLPMVALGRKTYPHVPFATGDATALPLKDVCCDILLSGTVLMHLLEYRKAIEESRRVAGRFCIFHTVPVVQKKATTFLEKSAYGERVTEVVLNESELLSLIQSNGMRVHETYPSVPHDFLSDLLGEPVFSRTYCCRLE